MTTMLGGCHCGRIRYEAAGAPLRHALCHCRDCRRHAGAPVVSWAIFPQSAVRVLKGAPKVYESSEYGRRYFCPDCGAGLFYANDRQMPGLIDLQSATLDDPNVIAPHEQVQVAERIGWMETAHMLPKHDRFPSQQQ